MNAAAGRQKQYLSSSAAIGAWRHTISASKGAGEPFERSVVRLESKGCNVCLRRAKFAGGAFEQQPTAQRHRRLTDRLQKNALMMETAQEHLCRHPSTVLRVIHTHLYCSKEGKGRSFALVICAFCYSINVSDVHKHRIPRSPEGCLTILAVVFHLSNTCV